MPYRNVEFRAGEYYHLYNRGNNFQPIFFEHNNYLYFLRLLRKCLVIEATEIVVYCLMPNHYHLVVYLKTDDLSSLMQPFALSYTKAINKRYNRVGSLFQGRFKAIHVDRDEYLLHLSRYIHLNPIADKLVRRMEDWEFSNYPEFIGLRNGKLSKPGKVLSYFPSSDDYRIFVEAYVEGDKEIIEHLTFD
ncbi:transposase [Candidatus Poribacteria bacterium]|nr:transposase [Candidatus Poribacteria bacterium]